MRGIDLAFSLGAHALLVAAALLWPMAHTAAPAKPLALAMVEYVRPQAVEPASRVPDAPPAPSAPPVQASPKPKNAPPQRTQPQKPVARTISPKKRPAPAKPETQAPSATPTPKPAQTNAEASPTAGVNATDQGPSPSRFIGGQGVYAAEVVDIAPKIVRRELPEYPQRAKRLRLEGTVLVSMVVDAQGVPGHLSVRQAAPQGVFEESALAAARACRFAPGKLRGQTVATLVILPFHFRMAK